MKKCFLIFLHFCSYSFFVNAQVVKEREVIANAGSYSSSPSIEISWTVGEVAVADFQVGNLILTEGFQQADQNAVSVQSENFSDQISVYPNPFYDQLNFEIKCTGPLNVQSFIFDLVGRMVMELPSLQIQSEFSGVIDFNQLPAGIWILQFKNIENGECQNFKVTKFN